VVFKIVIIKVKVTYMAYFVISIQNLNIRQLEKRKKQHLKPLTKFQIQASETENTWMQTFSISPRTCKCSHFDYL